MDNSYLEIYTEMYDYTRLVSNKLCEVYVKTTNDNVTTLYYDKPGKYVLVKNKHTKEKIRESDVSLLILNQLDYHTIGEFNV